MSVNKLILFGTDLAYQFFLYAFKIEQLEKYPQQASDMICLVLELNISLQFSKNCPVKVKNTTIILY